MSNFTAIGLIVFLMPLVSPAKASEYHDSFASRNQVGVRLGGWVNNGDTIPESFNFSGGLFESKIHKGSFYFEGFYAHRVFNQLLLEFSLGVSNRGSVTIQQGNLSDVGNLMIYPVLIHARLYPFGFVDSRLQPFATFGGGLYYARQTIQFTNDYFDATYREKSASDFGLSFGAGVDWLLGSNLALEFYGRYSPIHFAKSLLTARDFDSVSLTVGFKYFYKSQEKKRPVAGGN